MLIWRLGLENGGCLRGCAICGFLSAVIWEIINRPFVHIIPKEKSAKSTHTPPSRGNDVNLALRFRERPLFRTVVMRFNGGCFGGLHKALLPARNLRF